MPIALLVSDEEVAATIKKLADHLRGHNVKESVIDGICVALLTLYRNHQDSLEFIEKRFPHVKLTTELHNRLWRISLIPLRSHLRNRHHSFLVTEGLTRLQATVLLEELYEQAHEDLISYRDVNRLAGNVIREIKLGFGFTEAALTAIAEGQPPTSEQVATISAADSAHQQLQPQG